MGRRPKAAGPLFLGGRPEAAPSFFLFLIEFLYKIQIWDTNWTWGDIRFAFFFCISLPDWGVLFLHFFCIGACGPKTPYLGALGHLGHSSAKRCPKPKAVRSAARPTVRPPRALSAEGAIGGAFKELRSTPSQSDEFLLARSRSVRVDGSNPQGQF